MGFEFDEPVFECGRLMSIEIVQRNIEVGCLVYAAFGILILNST